MEDEEAEASRHNAQFGEEVYKAAGSPMFTRLWTYEELLHVERPRGRYGRRRPQAHADFPRPDSWPSDVEVDKGEWVFWLPEGWAQGLRTHVQSGKVLKCWFSPEGKRFWHKPKIEQYLKRELPKEPPSRPKEQDEDGKTIKTVRYVTDPDAIPNWPEDEEEWLPREFKIGYRQLPSGLHRIYVPPGKEDDGFLYHRTTVMDWLAGEPSLSPFGTSKPMAAISAAATTRKTSTKRKARELVATLADFTEGASLRAVRLEGPAGTYAAALGEALRGTPGAPDPAGLAADAGRISAALAERGFRGTELLYAHCAHDGRGRHPLAAVLSSFYYRRPDPWEGEPLYQAISLQPDTMAGVACGHVHLFWSAGCADGGRWRLGQLGEDGLAGCLALSAGASMSGGWLLAPLE